LQPVFSTLVKPEYNGQIAQRMCKKRYLKELENQLIHFVLYRFCFTGKLTPEIYNYIISDLFEIRLGTMGAQWRNLPMVQSKLEQDIIIHCTSSVLNEGEFSDTRELLLRPKLPNIAFFYFLEGCQNLSYRWNLNIKVREAIFSGFCECFHVSQPFHPSFLYCALRDFGLVGLTWNVLRADVKMTIFERIRTHSGQLDLPLLLSG
jgi:hypothetical protein